MAAPLSAAVSRTWLPIDTVLAATLLNVEPPSVEYWAVVASVGEFGPTVKVSVPHGEVASLFWPLLEVNTACH